MKGYSTKPIRFFMRCYDIEGGYDTGLFPISHTVNRILLCSLKRSHMKQTQHEQEVDEIIKRTIEFSYGNHNMQFVMVLTKSYARAGFLKEKEK